MTLQLSRGSAGEYQADERAGVARLSWSLLHSSVPSLYSLTLGLLFGVILMVLISLLHLSFCLCVIFLISFSF